MRSYLALLTGLGLLLLLLVSCSSGPGPSQQDTRLAPDSPESSAGLRAQLLPDSAMPPFPAVDVAVAPRTPSFLISSSLRASEPLSQGPGALIRGDLPGFPMDLSALEGEASWARYDFVGIGETVSGLQLTVYQTDEDGGAVAAQPLWVGWADHSTSRWRWTFVPGTPEGDSIELGSGDEAVSAGGAVSLAVLAYDDAHVLISHLELSRDCVPAVTNFSAVGSAANVTLSWDPVPESEGYRLFYADTSLPDPVYELLTEFDDPLVAEFVHSDIFPVGKEADYGVLYSYAIELILSDSLDLSCERVEAARILGTPQDVRASSKLHTDAIRIRWSAVEEATSYKIYRDDGVVEIDEVPAGMHFFQDEDPVIWDGAEYSYAVRAVSAAGESLLSEAALGAVADYQGFTIDNSLNLESTSPEVVLYNNCPVVGSFDYESNNPYVSISAVTDPLAFTDFSGHAVDTTNDGIGASQGLAVVDGRLAQAYSYKSGDGMRYARALVDQPAAASEWELTVIDDMNTGAWARLAIIAGLPAVAFVDGDDALRFGIASDTTPAAPVDWTKFNIEAAGNYRAPQIVELGGMAALCYIRSYDELLAPVDDLHFARATNATPDGPEDFVSFVVDSVAEVKNQTAMLLLDGRPVIAYADHSGPSPLVKLAIGLTETPSSAADFELRTIYTSLIGAHILDISMALCSSGLIMSFTEAQDGPGGDYHLQVLRSNNMPPLDQLDCMTQDFGGSTIDPAGGQCSWAFALGNGAAALVYGQYNGGSMRTELVYLAESS